MFENKFRAVYSKLNEFYKEIMKDFCPFLLNHLKSLEFEKDFFLNRDQFKK